jgi:S-adenosylmethionine decarboxylase
MEKEMGLHLIAELSGCQASSIATKEVVKGKIEKLVKRAGLTEISAQYHQFKEFGVTSFIFLDKSHLFLHTWPEYGYVAADVFTCGEEEKAYITLKGLIDEFKPKNIKEIVIKRGVNYS